MANVISMAHLLISNSCARTTKVLLIMGECLPVFECIYPTRRLFFCQCRHLHTAAALFYEFHEVSHPQTTKTWWLPSVHLWCKQLRCHHFVYAALPLKYAMRSIGQGVNTFSKNVSSLHRSLKCLGYLFREIMSVCCYISNDLRTILPKFCGGFISLMVIILCDI